MQEPTNSPATSDIEDTVPCKNWIYRNLYGCFNLLVLCLSIPISITLAVIFNINYVWILALGPVLAFVPEIIKEVLYLYLRYVRRKPYEFSDGSDEKSQTLKTPHITPCVLLIIPLTMAGALIIIGIPLYIYVKEALIAICIAGLYICVVSAVLKIIIFST